MKNKKYILLTLIFSIIVVAFSGLYIKNGDKNNSDNCIDNSIIELNNNLSQNNQEELKIYFFPLGNNLEGDCCIITYKDIQILVDAGSKSSSCETIINQIEEIKMKDKVWDYIIVTHSDEDHIAAFCTNYEFPNNDNGIFQYFINNNIQIGTLIDFDFTNDDTVHLLSQDKYFKSQVCQRYFKKRDSMILNKQIERYFTASQCCWKIREKNNFIDSKDLNNKGYIKAKENGATNSFELAPKLSLNILYNYYYDHRITSKEYPDGTPNISSGDINIISTCFLIKYDSQKFLFTGDLGEIDSSTHPHTRIYGETKLIQYNRDILENVTLYKAAHHGKNTSSSKEFIDFIKPEFVVVPCIAGTSFHKPSDDSERSPAQSVINNLFSYTSKIYPISKANFTDGDNFLAVDYYGKIRFTSNGKSTIAETTSEHKNNKSQLGTYDIPRDINETSWFKDNRYANLNIHVFNGFKNKDEVFYGNCTLLKYGSFDILIDCGFVTANNKDYNASRQTILVDKVSQYVVDRRIECLIVTTSCPSSYHQIVDINNKKGILSRYNICNLIDYGEVPDPSKGSPQSNYKLYNDAKNNIINKQFNYYGELLKTRYFDGTMYVNNEENMKLHFPSGFSIDILDNPFYGRDDDNSLAFMIEFNGLNFLFTGRNGKKCEEQLIMKNQFKNVFYYQGGDFGCANSNSLNFLKVISKDINPIIVVNTAIGKKYGTKEIMNRNVSDRLKSFSKKVIVLTDYDGRNYIDLDDFTLTLSNKYKYTNNDNDNFYSFIGGKDITETFYYRNQ